MWYVFGHLLVGWITIYGAAVIHLIRAEQKGYAALEWWGNYHAEYNDDFFRAFVIGSFIWPIRFVEFLSSIPKYYDLYELKT